MISELGTQNGIVVFSIASFARAHHGDVISSRFFGSFLASPVVEVTIYKSYGTDAWWNLQVKFLH